MAYGKRRQIAQLLQELQEAEYSWLSERGLAALLRYDIAHPEPDDDADGDYSECEGAPGLRGLLYYVDPRTERPSM